MDEAPHICFQQERLSIIFRSKNVLYRRAIFYFYKFFYFSTTLTVWFAHRKLFKAGKNDFGKYYKKMSLKFDKTIGKLKTDIKEDPATHQYQATFQH